MEIRIFIVTLLDWMIGLFLTTICPDIGFCIMALWAMIKCWLEKAAIIDPIP